MSFRLLLLFAIPIQLVFANEADRYLSKNRELFFNKLVNEVESSHVFLNQARVKAFSWKGNLPKIKKMFKEAKTKTEVYYAILALQKNLKNNHSSLRMPDKFYEFDIRSRSLPFRLQYTGTNYEVSLSEHTRVKLGLVLKSINGKPVSQVEEELLLWHGSSSLNHFRQEFSRLLTRPTAWKQPIPKGPSVKVELIDPKTGTVTIISLPWSKYDLKSEYPKKTSCSDALPHDKDYKNYKITYVGINYCIYQSSLKNTLLVRFFSFDYYLREKVLRKRLSLISPEHKKGLSMGSRPSELERKDLKHLTEQVNKAGKSNLLIDIRENRGGNINPELLSTLAKKQYKILARKFVFTKFTRNNQNYLKNALDHGREKMRSLILEDFKDKKKKESRMFPFYCKTQKCDLKEKYYPPFNSLENDKLYILSGPQCLSSCDQFVSIIKDNGLGTILGLPSQGSHAPFRANKTFSLANGQKFTFQVVNGVGYRANGELLEGNPPQPDVKFYFNSNGLKKAETIISGQ